MLRLIACFLVLVSVCGCSRGMKHVSTQQDQIRLATRRREKAPPTAAACFQGMELIELKSSRFNRSQLAYYRKASSPMSPLVISLHSWGTTYEQKDELAQAAKEHDWNYIHPDYGGAQFKDCSCCYPESIQDIDDAATFGVADGADPQRMAFIGKSGGGTGVLAAYLESQYSNATYLAWAPIPDQVSWHEEVLKSADLSKRYLQKILEGTKSSANAFNVAEAKKKSPFYFDFANANYPQHKKLKIYAGIRDGLDGWSTSLSQPLAFYNKLVSTLPGAPQQALIGKTELATLVNNRHGVQQGDLGSVGPRKVLHHAQFKDIELVVFDGGHEIIDQQAIKDLEKAFQK